MLPDSVFAQVLPGSAASVTDRFQGAVPFLTVLTGTTASVHILSRTMSRLGTSNPTLKQRREGLCP
jgi:hypothetical protein